MARLRRTSQVLEAGRQRLAGLKSISPPPTFGPNITLNGFEATISAFDQKLKSYNEAVAALDDLQNGVEADEDNLREMNKRILSAVEAQYGPDSSEYEQAGGTRVSERKKPTPKAPSGPPPATAALSMAPPRAMAASEEPPLRGVIPGLFACLLRGNLFSQSRRVKGE